MAGAGEARLPLAVRRRPSPRRGYKVAALTEDLLPRISTAFSSALVARRPPAPTMTTIQQLVGRWRLVESKGFEEYMKELGEALGGARNVACVCVCVSPRPPRRAGLGRTCSAATSNLFLSSSRLQSPPRGPGPHAALHHAAQPPGEPGLRATCGSQESRVSRRVVHPALCHFTHFPSIFLSPPLIFPVPGTLLSRPIVGALTPPSPPEPPLPHLLFLDGVRVSSFFSPGRGTCRRESERHYSLSCRPALAPTPGSLGDTAPWSILPSDPRGMTSAVLILSGIGAWGCSGQVAERARVWLCASALTPAS